MKTVWKRAAVLLAVLPAAFLLSVPFVNDLTARRVADGLQSLPLPGQTQLVDTASAAGKLVGSGNGMQYFGAVLLRSGLSLEELEAYYAGHERECCVEKQDGGAIRVIEHGSLRFDTEIDGGGYYIVYSWGTGRPFFREFDLRGH